MHVKEAAFLSLLFILYIDLIHKVMHTLYAYVHYPNGQAVSHFTHTHIVFYILYIIFWVGLQPWLDWTLTDLASTIGHVNIEVSR